MTSRNFQEAVCEVPLTSLLIEAGSRAAATCPRRAERGVAAGAGHREAILVVAAVGRTTY